MSTSSETPKKFRKFWSHLLIEDYILMELEAHRRGMTPYELTTRILTAWLRANSASGGVGVGAASSPSSSVVPAPCPSIPDPSREGAP